jgi:hypothetical protein
MSRTRSWADDSSISIKLSGGASVVLTFKGNFFDLTTGERDLIANLSNIIQKYKATVTDQQYPEVGEPATNHQES